MWIAVSVSQLSQWAGAQWGQKCSVNSCIWVIMIHSNNFTNYFLKLFRLKPSISSHSKPRMRSRTRRFKCFVLNILCSKIKPLTFLKLIYTGKMIQPGIFFRFSQPVHFSRLYPENLAVLSRRLSGLNLEKCTGWLNLEKIPGWIILQI